MTDAPAQDVPIQLPDGQVNPTWYERLAEVFSGWKAYTPAVTSGTGAFTSVAATGRFKKIGKTVHFQVRIAITTNGTAATYIAASLPVAAGPVDQTASGITTSGLAALAGVILAATQAIRIYTVAGAYPGANGVVAVISGTYEAAK